MTQLLYSRNLLSLTSWHVHVWIVVRRWWKPAFVEHFTDHNHYLVCCSQDIGIRSYCHHFTNEEADIQTGSEALSKDHSYDSIVTLRNLILPLPLQVLCVSPPTVMALTKTNDANDFDSFEGSVLASAALVTEGFPDSVPHWDMPGRTFDQWSDSEKPFCRTRTEGARYLWDVNFWWEIISESITCLLGFSLVSMTTGIWMALGQENKMMNVGHPGSRFGGDAKWHGWVEVPEGTMTRQETCTHAGMTTSDNGVQQQHIVPAHCTVNRTLWCPENS